MINIKMDVDYEALASKLSKKSDEAPGKLADALNESGLAGQRILIDAAPRGVGTPAPGTLKASHTVESNGLLERVIFPDEGRAPYAWYVILGHLTRPSRGTSARNATSRYNVNSSQRWVKGNDYPRKSASNIQKAVEDNIQEFIDWAMQ